MQRLLRIQLIDFEKQVKRCHWYHWVFEDVRDLCTVIIFRDIGSFICVGFVLNCLLSTHRLRGLNDTCLLPFLFPLQYFTGKMTESSAPLVIDMILWIIQKWKFLIGLKVFLVDKRSRKMVTLSVYRKKYYSSIMVDPCFLNQYAPGCMTSWSSDS